MNEAVENAYFNWLCHKVIDVSLTDPSQTYWKLFKIMFGTEFVWTVAMDENRAVDGKDLRKQFLLVADIPDDPVWREEIPCSVLEMLVAFAIRAEDMTDIPYRELFWEFIMHLELEECTDELDMDESYIKEVLDTFMWRTYDYFGRGGICPITHPSKDQRTVDIWYQFCEYVAESGRLP